MIFLVLKHFNLLLMSRIEMVVGAQGYSQNFIIRKKKYFLSVKESRPIRRSSLKVGPTRLKKWRVSSEQWSTPIYENIFIQERIHSEKNKQMFVRYLFDGFRDYG